MLCPSSMSERRYSREEVDAILGRVVERERTADDLSHDQLVAVAQEVGLSAASIERAIAEISSERRDHDELVQLRRNDWRGFLHHLIPYLCVCGLLVMINVLTTSFPWSLFPILGWGIGILSHLLAVAMPNRDNLERRLQRRRERDQQRERRLRARHRIDASAKEFEAAVTHGAAALLQAAANRINQGAEPLHKDSRFRVNDPERSEAPTEDSTDADLRRERRG
jgi:hypothetical protein